MKTLKQSSRIVLMWLILLPRVEAQPLDNTLTPVHTMSDVINTTTHNTRVHSGESTSTLSKSTMDIVNLSDSALIAHEWHLTDTEWKNYIALMQGMSGHYYQTLSPPEVLGISAHSDKERDHYAEIAATLEHDKLTQELAFNAAFYHAAKQLYPTEPIINSFDYTPFNPS